MSSLGGRLRELTSYTILGQNYASLAYGNFKTLKVVSSKTVSHKWLPILNSFVLIY